MDETRQTIADLLVSDNPADHARARELHDQLVEARYLSTHNNEIGAVIIVEPDKLTVRERIWMTLWTLFCFAGVGLAGWAMAFGFIALFDLLGISGR